MNYTMLSLYLLTAFALIATPGPVIALVINTSSIAGSRRAFTTALGSNGASLILIALGTLVLVGFISIGKTALSLLSLAGCVFILYVSTRGVRAALAGEVGPQPAAARSRKPPQSGFLTGLFVGLSNPSDILFFVSFFPQFIRITESFGTSLTVLSTCYVILDVTILAGYVFLMRNGFAHSHRRAIALISSSCLLLVSLSGIAYSVSGILPAAV
jgi:threonine/homoserine/homoserine lactone efflux protein